MRLEITDDQAEELVIEMLKGDLRGMIGDEREEIKSIADVLRYYMPPDDYESFLAEVGYNQEAMGGFIDVVDVVDNPDGSADITVSITDEKLKKSMIEEGLEYTLLKNAFGLTSDDVVRLVQRVDKRVEELLKDFEGE